MPETNLTRPQSPQRPTDALELDGLHKEFAEQVAVDRLTLTVPAGSFYGVLGPNGAGKTTALAMATGLLRPDAGTARVLGFDIWADPAEAKALVGVLPDGLGLPERLTGMEVLTYLGLLRGLPGATVRERSLELLDVLELPQDSDKLVVEYSMGMRKKIGLAVALLHAPRLLVLDEPFEAVDPVSAAAIQNILERFVANGGSVVLSSHVMALVENLCDRVAVINEGRLLADGTLAQVRAGGTLEEAFVSLVGARTGGMEGLSWLWN